MGIESTSALFGARLEQIKQKKENLGVAILEPTTQPILLRPTAKSWGELTVMLEKVVNLPGLMDSRIKELFDQGYAAELETAAEIALATAKKTPYHLFASMVSKKSGNWQAKTLEVVKATWEARRNTAIVMEKLNLDPNTTRQILALSWRLKGSIMRYLGMATEPGCNIKNSTGLFFWLTKKKPVTA